MEITKALGIDGRNKLGGWVHHREVSNRSSTSASPGKEMSSSEAGVTIRSRDKNEAHSKCRHNKRRNSRYEARGNLIWN